MNLPPLFIILAILSIPDLLTVSGHAADSVTYHRDIAPILARRCNACHEPGGAAPFPLATYRDGAKRSKMLLHVTETGIMPPWKADPEYRSFANERRMPPEEIDLLRRWVRAGAPAGDSLASAPAPDTGITTRPRTTPDLVLKMPQAFPIPANGRPTYICVKIPYEIARDTFVRAIDFIPGNRRLVHHASYQILEVADDVDTRAGPSIQIYADSTGDAPDDERQFRYFRLIGRKGRDGQLEKRMPRLVFHTGWLPGTSPQKFPAGMGFRLPKKGVLLIRSLHYSPTNVKASDRSTVHLFFARREDGPVKRKVEFAAFKPEAALVPDRAPLFIPADTVMRYEINNTVPLDVSVLAINPHMHLLGKSFKVFAVTPAGDTLRLIHIPDWDFNWQEFYRFRNPVFIPQGSRLHAEAWYDNTRNNPANPFDPPRRAFFERGMDDTDEMMRLVIQYVPWRLGDDAIVQEE